MDFDQYYLQDIKFCPKCGAGYNKDDFTMPEALFDCKDCGFQFYHQSKYGAAPIIPQVGNPHKLLLGTRNIEPQKGLLDLPGGFLNFAEDPKAAVTREVKEELGVDLVAERLIYSNGQPYQMQGRMWFVMNLYYVTSPVPADVKFQFNHEVQKAQFYDLDYLISDDSSMAFPAEKEALKHYAKLI